MRTAILLDLDNFRPDLAELDLMGTFEGRVEVRWAFSSYANLPRLVAMQLSHYGYRWEVLPFRQLADHLDRRIVETAQSLAGKIEQIVLASNDRELMRAVLKASQARVLWTVQGDLPKPVPGEPEPTSLYLNQRRPAVSPATGLVPMEEWRAFLARGRSHRFDLPTLCRATAASSVWREAQSLLLAVLMQISPAEEPKAMRILAALTRLPECQGEPDLRDWWATQMRPERRRAWSRHFQFLLAHLPVLCGLWGCQAILAELYRASLISARPLLMCPQSDRQRLENILLVFRQARSAEERWEACGWLERLLREASSHDLKQIVQHLIDLTDLPSDIRQCALESVRHCAEQVDMDSSLREALRQLCARDAPFLRWATGLSLRNPRRFVRGLEQLIAEAIHTDPDRAARLVALELWQATQCVAGLRGYFGCTRAEMAALLGLHPKTVVRWETRKTRPSDSSRTKIELLLEQHLAKLAAGSEWSPLSRASLANRDGI